MDPPFNPAFDEQTKKLERAMTGLVEDLDKAYLRKLHADMHKCAASCCLRTDDSLEKVYNCVEKCRMPVDRAWGFVEAELQAFHDKLSRCLDTCTARNKWSSPSSELQLTRSTRELEDCSNKCVETTIKIIPSMLKKIKDHMNPPNTTKSLKRIDVDVMPD